MSALDLYVTLGSGYYLKKWSIMHEQSFKIIAYVPNNPFSFQQVFNRDRGHQIVDKLVKSRKAPVVVIPAKAGIQ